MGKVKSFMFERNYLILFSGVLVNSIGGKMYAVAGMLLVLSLTESVLYSGLAYFLITLANALSFLIAPFANYVDYKKALISCEFLKSILLFTIPIFSLFGNLSIYYLLALLFLVALINQFTFPIEATILPTIVGRDNIIKANASFQSVRQGMDIIFFAASGVIVALTGSAEAILITALCHLISAITYFFFNFKPIHLNTDKPTFSTLFSTYKKDLKSGFLYIKGSVLVKMIASIVFINFIMGMMMPTLPAFSLQQGGTEMTYGFFLASLSIGTLIGISLASKLKTLSFGWLTISSFAFTGVSWIIASLSPVVVSIAFFGLGAVAVGIFNILLVSTIQYQAETSMIGRILTLVKSTASISMPIGSLLGGILGTYLPIAYPLMISGIAIIIFSLSWLINGSLRSLPQISKTQIFKRDNVTV